MNAARLLLGLFLVVTTVAGHAAPAVTDFLPGLRAHPTLNREALRAGGVTADVSYLDWGAARIDLQDWMARDPVAPWISLWNVRGRVTTDDWRLLRRELVVMARFHVTPQYGLFVQSWEGSVRGFPRDTKEWQRHVDERPRKLGVLTQIASEDITGDLATTANFVWVQNVEAARKAELIDIALHQWSTRRGFDEPAAWLFMLGTSGIVWNLPAAWMAVDCFATKPDLAVKLLTRVDDPTLRQIAILAIAAAAPDAAAIEPLRPLADEATWGLIAGR